MKNRILGVFRGVIKDDIDAGKNVTSYGRVYRNRYMIHTGDVERGTIPPRLDSPKKPMPLCELVTS